MLSTNALTQRRGPMREDKRSINPLPKGLDLPLQLGGHSIQMRGGCTMRPISWHATPISILCATLIRLLFRYEATARRTQWLWLSFDGYV
ncbi:hypothetical protein CEXT_542581 [Caerostris extrusa]|uniref:Uncharacterized protein n=1 Tax=Caerostris extrusa TaxID=172846 RepID=A0AAV4XYG9_CAEEX|nr:hypothetical protein CEXT_542581 [Caerostris extrusa]